MPVKRLLISSVVSGGLYQIYWMYKNWQAVRRDTRDNQISPVVRGWLLGIFYIYPLLQTVRLNLQRSKTEGRHFTQLAVAYTACLFIQTGLCAAFYYGSARLPYLYAVWFALTAVWLTGLYLLITLQKRINFHNRKKKHQTAIAKRLALGRSCSYRDRFSPQFRLFVLASSAAAK